MSECATCGELGERVDANLAAGEALPAAASKLEPIAGGDARRCPTCDAWFLYQYEYEYNALGPSWEDVRLRRIEPDRVKEVLLAAPPSDTVFQALARLGVVDGEAAIMTKLHAELDEPRTSYDAVRRLVDLHLGKSDIAAPDIAAIARLLGHARAEVRKDTLYSMQSHRGSLDFRAAAASTDPSVAVRMAAATAAFGTPSRELSLVPAIIACLHDADEAVRSNAAWTLAVFAERNEDVRVSLPVLEARLAKEPSAKVRTTVERAVNAIRAAKPPTRRVEVPAPTAAGPPIALAVGCERCFGTDAKLAWDAIHSSTEASLISDVHFAVDIMACSCGQRFAVVFTERVNYRDGGDDLTWLALPITNDEHARVSRCGASSVASVLTELGVDRRFLVRNQAGGPVDAWWRSSGFSIDPSVPRPDGPAMEAVQAGPPVAWLLSSDEVAELWALGVPLEAAHVPDHELRVAIANRRVKRAVSYGSMGTADTYWGLAGRDDSLAVVRGDGAVVPGDTAIETPYEDHIDDRDVDKVLWGPFFRDQAEALARCVPPARHLLVVAEYARMLADLEERWADGPKLDARAPFLEWLRADECGDKAELERWLVERRQRSVHHLIDGIRARWLSHDIASAFHAVIASAERFTDHGETLRQTRLELLRCGVRVARARAPQRDALLEQ